MTTKNSRQGFAILLFLLVMGCAKSNTRLMVENEADDRSFDEGGAESDSVLSDSSRSTDSTNAAGNEQMDAKADDRVIEATDSAAEGQPLFITDTNPTLIRKWNDPLVKEERYILIDDYCTSLRIYDCLNSYYDRFEFESIEQLRKYCEEDIEIQSYGYASVSDECGTQWQNVLQCAGNYDYECYNCPGDECKFISWYEIGSASVPCQEKRALLTRCDDVRHQQTFDVTGKRTSCTGFVSAFNRYSCQAICRDNEVGAFELFCDPLLEGELGCYCSLNNEPLPDAYEHFSTYTYPPFYQVFNCEDAVQEMADGACHNIVNCCFTWVDDDGTEGCNCTADPTLSLTGSTTCEELAAALGGEVVDLCPQYKEATEKPPQ